MIKKLTVSAFIYTSFAAEVLAAGPSKDGYPEAKGGLPQLDPSSYPSQIFWMVIVFTFMYVFFARKSLPQISRTIENRSERIKNDLDSAERLRTEVETVQKSYEDRLAEARSQSSDFFKDIEAEIKLKSEKQFQDFQDNSVTKIAQLEKNIVKARSSAIEDMGSIAANLAADAAEKIIGVRADEKTAKAVIKKLNKAA